MPAKTVLITGCSTGFGKLAAVHFAEQGWNVVATMRTPEKENDLTKLSNVLVPRLDVQDQASVDAAVGAAQEKFGGIDVLVNNAGYGALGLMEATPIEEVKRQFDVNFFGVVRVTQAVLPLMRKAKSGTIVNISSVLGALSGPFASIYGASKWALEGWAEMMSYELLPFGIQVKLVQPGAFQTSFMTTSIAMHLEVKAEGGEAYAPMAERFKSTFEGAKLADAKPVGATIFAAATEGDAHKLRYPVYAEEDGYGKLYELRKNQGAEAQYAVVVASPLLQPNEKNE